MANQFDFKIESGKLGTRLLCGGHAMTPRLMSDAEVDFEAEEMKRQVDLIAKDLKKAIVKAAAEPLEFG